MLITADHIITKNETTVLTDRRSIYNYTDTYTFTNNGVEWLCNPSIAIVNIMLVQ